jgi:hypothetical protein
MVSNMSGVTALKKINTRTKQLKKLHPGKKYATLRKQAASEYNSGSLPKKRRKRARVSGKKKYSVTHRVKKVGTHKKRKRHTTKKQVVTRTRTRTKTVYRRVGASGKSSMMPLAIAALGLGALYLFTRSSSSSTLPTLNATANPARAQAQNSLLQYAQAAGYGIDAIANLIYALNNSTDAAVVSAAQTPQQTIDTTLAVPTGGPSIHLG